MALSRRLFLSSVAQTNFDVVVVGGGILGCATAKQLLQDRPKLKVALLEKESQLALHQSGHNSGVIHAGVYYQPGSLKARLCVEGINLMYQYLNKKQIPYKQCGKLIVAVDNDQVNELHKLYKRAERNGCKNIELINAKNISEIQPHCNGLEAIWSPYTGIVDYALVTKHYAADFEHAGGTVFLEQPLCAIEESTNPEYPIRLISTNDKLPLQAKFVITCAGLQSDRVAQLTGCSSVPKIMPFRGEYLFLKPDKQFLVTTNIYPVPNPRFPFLGVHFTPTMKGEIIIGPNAVLAFKREGYSYSDFSARDFWDSISYKGMLKLMLKHTRFGLSEYYRGIFIGAQVRQLQRLVPQIQRKDVTRGLNGVRAQALDENGVLLDDFVFDQGKGKLALRMLHCRNAPSPGATSSLSIAKLVAQKAIKNFQI